MGGMRNRRRSILLRELTPPDPPGVSFQGKLVSLTLLLIAPNQAWVSNG